jgi:hypothetical protein
MNEPIITNRFKKISVASIAIAVALWIIAVLTTGVKNQETCAYYGSPFRSIVLVFTAQAMAILPTTFHIVVYLQNSITKIRLMKSLGLFILALLSTSVVSAACFVVLFMKLLCFIFLFK